MAATKRRSAISIVFPLVSAVVIWIAIGPLLMLLFSSVTADRNRLPFESPELSLENYFHILTSGNTLQVLFNTAAFTIGATTVGVGAAIFMAWLIERTDVWGRRTLFVLVLIPMAIPSTLYAMSWTLLLTPNSGFINVLLKNIGLGFIEFNVYSLGSMIAIQGLSLACHAYLLIAVAFRTLDASWEEQSFVAGHRVFETVRRITLPILKPALFAALLFFTVVSLETFDIPITLGLTSRIQVFSTQIYWDTHPESGRLPSYGLASAQSVIFLIIALALIRWYQRQTQSAKSFVTITGRGYRQGRMKLGRWRWPLFVLGVAFIIVAVALPVLMLIWRSLLRFYLYPSARAFSLLNVNAYLSIFSDPDMPRVLFNTSVLTVVSAGLASIIAAAVAWQVVRSTISPQWRKRLHTLAFLPQSFPSVVIGLALVLIYIWLPLPIYGTIWIIVLAMLTKFVAYSTGTMIAAQMQVSTELEEASRVSGAGSTRTYWRIVLPLIFPALVACFLWVAIHVVRELGLALILYTLQSQVLSTKLWLLWENGRVADACATGVLTIVVLLALLALPALFRNVRGLLNRLRSRPSLQNGAATEASTYDYR